MKSIIESSAYCIILVIMCYMAIGFIQMNMDVNKVNEVSKYVQDYMEAVSYTHLDVYKRQATGNVYCD